MGDNHRLEAYATIGFDMRGNTLTSSDQWQPELYDSKHAFVWELGALVIELLAPQVGERILDVGCGTGQLTAQIAETGATVVGIDNSSAMLDEARRLFPALQFQLHDAHEFNFAEPFDAVFSNAALHWITDPDKVVGCIARAIKPGGRLAVEFGGCGNVFYVSGAIESAYEMIFGEKRLHPWYFPSIAEFASLLSEHGLEVTQAALIDRPTPLEGDDGLRNWVKMFGQHWLENIPADQQDEFLSEIEHVARANLLRDSIWHADYRRLRVLAVKV